MLLRPPLERVDLLDWQAFGRAIDIGYRCAADALENQITKIASMQHRPAPAD